MKHISEFLKGKKEDLEFIDALKKVVEYNYEDEKDDYYSLYSNENGDIVEPLEGEHIYTSLVVLKNWLEQN